MPCLPSSLFVFSAFFAVKFRFVFIGIQRSIQLEGALHRGLRRQVPTE